MKARGYTLLELMITVGLTGLVVITVLTVYSQSFSHHVSGYGRASISIFRNEIHNAIKNEEAWLKTVDGPLNTSGMSCLKNSTPCTADGSPAGTPITDRSFAIYDSQGELIYDGTSATAGLTKMGELCSTYSPLGSDTCPFRYDLTWSAKCEPGACVNPVIFVSARLRYSPGSNSQPFVLNPQYYSVAAYLPLGAAAAPAPSPSPAPGPTPGPGPAPAPAPTPAPSPPVCITVPITLGMQCTCVPVIGPLVTTCQLSCTPIMGSTTVCN